MALQEYPIPRFHFQVDWGGAKISFTEVTGLDMQVEVIDSVADYLAVMRELFDFDLLRGMFARGFTMRVDAMNAVGGPYAKAILEGELGAPAGTVVNATPLEDFGGLHPDPNPVNAEDLISHGRSPDASGGVCHRPG